MNQPKKPSGQCGPHATDDLFAAVYHELRALATSKLAKEKPGQTLQPTALVHDAYLRLTSETDAQKWNSPSHFYAAAAEAMRRILVDRAREKKASKRGGKWERIAFETAQLTDVARVDELLSVNEMFDRLTETHPDEGSVAKLHYFAGFNISEAARLLDLPVSSAHRYWAFARAWLIREIGDSSK